MKKHFNPLVLILFIILFSSERKDNDNANPDKLFSTKELQTDFQSLRAKLEKNHPNLYLYTPKKELDHYFDSLYQTINHSATAIEFYNCITTLYNKINDGHTFFLLSEKSRNYYNQFSPFLPFDLKWINQKLYVIHNCSSDSTIAPGNEILQINTISATEIAKTMLAHQLRDGNNMAYSHWIINTYFRDYFSFTFGHPSEFQIEFKNKNNRIQTSTIRGLTKDSIRYYRNRNSPTISKAKDEGISLELISGIKSATLKIKSFDNAVLKSVYNQNFKISLTTIFKQIKENNVENLILDLRDNQGGDDQNAKLLLSYLMDTTFELVYKGPASGKCNPQSNPFKGKVICLINGGSFSVTGMVTSCLFYNHRATFIGQATGGNKIIVSGSATSFSLPNTKIYCEISKRTWQIRNLENEGQGTIPDYIISNSIEDILIDRDTECEFAKKFILSNN